MARGRGAIAPPSPAMAEHAPPSAVDNAFRIAALARTTALDAPSDPVLDALSRAAAEAVDAPTAMVSLVTAERQAFVGATGLPAVLGGARETPISHSLCARVVAGHGPLLDRRRARGRGAARPPRGRGARRRRVPRRAARRQARRGVRRRVRDRLVAALLVVRRRPRSWSASQPTPRPSSTGAARPSRPSAAPARTRCRRSCCHGDRRRRAADRRARPRRAPAPVRAAGDDRVGAARRRAPGGCATARHPTCRRPTRRWSTASRSGRGWGRAAPPRTSARRSSSRTSRPIRCGRAARSTRSRTACAPAGRCRSWRPTAGCSRPSRCTTRRRRDRTRPTGRCSSTRASSRPSPSSRRWARDRLRTSEARHRAMVETIVDGVDHGRRARARSSPSTRRSSGCSATAPASCWASRSRS